MTDLPSNLEAERALIGACISRGKIDGPAGRVAPSDFSNRVNSTIWEAVSKLSAMDQPLDIISVTSALKGTDLGHAEAGAEITMMIGEVPSTAHVDKYAELVLTMAAKRKLAGVLNKLSKIAFGNGAFDPYSVFANAMAAIERAGEGIQPAERESWTAAELAALEIPDDPWLLDRLLIDGGLNLIAGEFASGKTFVCIDLAIGAASGGIAWGRTVKSSNVLYFGADNSRSNLIRRIRLLCDGRGIDPPHENLIFDISPIDLSQPAGMATIKSSVIKHNAGLVIIDAIIRYLGKLDENSAADIGSMMAGFRSIANLTGCTFVLVHHLRKLSGQLTKAKIADRVRGSGDFIGAVDSAMVLSTRGEGQLLSRHLVQVKCREAEEIESLTFEIHPGEEIGTVLTFGPGTMAIATETIAKVAVEVMIQAMKKSPHVIFTKKDLRDELEAVQMTDLSSRSEDRAFSMLKDLTMIQFGKSGRFNTYKWLGDNDYGVGERS